jgi:hypothetical protein
LSLAQDGLPLHDVLAGIADVLTRHNRVIDRQHVVTAIGVFHHDHGVGPFRNNGAGGDGRGHAGLDLYMRHHTGSQMFIGEVELSGAFLVHPKGVGGDDRKAVHVRTVKIRHVDGGDDVA